MKIGGVLQHLCQDESTFKNFSAQLEFLVSIGLS